MLVVKVGNPVQELDESRKLVAGLPGEIGAGKERQVIVRRQEDGQWPAPGSSCQQLVCALVDPVEIGTLFAINLDIDEQLVHNRSGPGILERLMGHDVTPVTGRVADR